MNKFDLIQKNILVIGDVMLDVYYNGDVDRISPEAPVPVFKKTSERATLGGSANVAANLIAARQNVSLMSVTGNDDAGIKLKNLLSQYGISTDFILLSERDTTQKIRFLASNHQQVMRLDIEDTSFISSDMEDKLISIFEKNIADFDLVLLSDYMKGILTQKFTQSVINISRKNNVPVVIDVKDPNYEKYKNATLLKPNLKELSSLTGHKVASTDDVITASEELRKNCNCDFVLTTCGKSGMVLVGGGDPYVVKAFGCGEVFDVTGAGDTAIAYLTACMANDYPMKDCVDIANTAAGIQVTKLGTSSVFLHEIQKKFTDNTNKISNKILNRDTIKTFREDNADKKIVFTNGCFDILHIGHIEYLQEAAKLGDLLVIGVNSDSSVKRLKGETRPINSEFDRTEILSALAFVDYVVIFDEDTPLNLIKEIQPDVLVKGGDYKPCEVVGREEVEGRGGKLVLIPFVDGKSTTGIISKIKG